MWLLQICQLVSDSREMRSFCFTCRELELAAGCCQYDRPGLNLAIPVAKVRSPEPLRHSTDQLPKQIPFSCQRARKPIRSCLAALPRLQMVKLESFYAVIAGPIALRNLLAHIEGAEGR